MISDDSGERKKLDQELAGFRGQVDVLWSEYISTEATTDEQTARDGFRTGLAASRRIADEQVLQPSRAGRIVEAAAAANSSYDLAFDQVSEALLVLDRLEEAQAQAGADHAESTYQSGRTLLIIILAAGFVLSLAIGVLVARTVSTVRRRSPYCLRRRRRSRRDRRRCAHHPASRRQSHPPGHRPHGYRGQFPPLTPESSACQRTRDQSLIPRESAAGPASGPTGRPGQAPWGFSHAPALLLTKNAQIRTVSSDQTRPFGGNVLRRERAFAGGRP
ncbi:MCP four helix bundle domain-containing protein [Actinoplanes sp. NBC_00393]|uniref:MCP four helix bundle domain-containing protein n=1 Tax=Actinoplanes sp. NBC_00393 TaxID=2975953 RepID=UPI002E1D8501